MGGQESPNFQRHPYAIAPASWVRDRCGLLRPRQRGWLTTLIIFVLLTLALPKLSSAFQSQQRGGMPPLSLRFAWGGGSPQKWQGSIAIEKGTFISLRPLAISGDAPSSVVLRDNSLAIDHRISTSYGGADVSARGDLKTSIQFSIKTDAGKEFKRTWTIGQLTAGVNELIDGQNRLTISPTPGDEIAVETNRPHLVFEPGESWQFELGLRRSELQQSDLMLRLYWLGGDKMQQRLPIPEVTRTLSSDRNGAAAFKPIELRVPQTEGAHQLLIEVESQAQAQAKKPNFGQFRRQPQLSRRIELVVVSPDRPPRSSMPFKPFRSWSAQQLHGGFRGAWPSLPLSKEPTREGKLSLVAVDGAAKSAIELETDAAISIPVAHPDGASAKGPIRVSLRYRSVPGTKIGINYLSATQQVLHGMDSGVAVARSAAGIETEEQWLEHVFHVWAEPSGGTVRIVNDASSPARIGEIELASGPASLSADLEPRVADPADPAKRQRMAFLESPDIVGLFQAQRIADPQTGQTLDNWNTFFDAAKRLAQHLKANSFDGAFVTVAANGSAIFPSAGLADGPRYDSGVFASDGRDPIQKDVLELMLRVFDREGLNLVPVLTLNSTIEPLERLRQSERMSFDLVADDGQRTGFNRKLLPVYNPLDRVLQSLCTRSIRRMADRYRSHSSFAGVALACRPDCCTLLPGAEHGRDNITMQRYENSHSASEDGSNEEAWLAWRSQQMAAWYHELQQQADKDLYLLPLDIDRRPEFIRAMNPSLQHGGDYGRAMKEVGLDLRVLENERVKLLAPRQVAAGFSLAQKRVDLNTRQSRLAEGFVAERGSGALFAHRGNWGSVDAVAKNAARLRLYTPAASANRRRYIESLRKHDCRLFVEGGASLPRVTDAASEAMLSLIRALPAMPFEDVGDAQQSPVCLRQLSLDGEHYFYAINDSPWPIKVSAKLEQRKLPQVLQASGSPNSLAPLTTTDGKEVVITRGVNGASVEIYLDPWSIYAAVAQTNSTYNPYAIDRFEIELPESSTSQLRKKIHQLKSKLAKAEQATPLPTLLNGSFESFADPQQSGWEFGNHEQAKFDLQSRGAHDGTVALSMRSTGRPVWIRSNSIQPPLTGRLSISAWLRTSDPGNPPPRVAIQGTADKVDFYRYAEVVGDNEAPLDSTWRKFAFHFDDLPEDLSDLRIGFDLLGPGQVSIDQVEIFDVWFDENESVAMTQLLASAGSRLQDQATIDSSRRVLENYWVQFLDQNIGRKEKQAAASRPSRSVLGLPEMPSFEFPQINPPTAELPRFRLQK